MPLVLIGRCYVALVSRIVVTGACIVHVAELTLVFGASTFGLTGFFSFGRIVGLVVDEPL